jgi:hypothetical protein
VPLIKVLLSPERPLNTTLEMVRPHCGTLDEDRPRLEVSFLDETIEEHCWAKVADSYLSNEDSIYY